ncbi:hypothetical protein B9T07_26845, partial [Limnospira fusiformis CCALA 023]
EGERTALALCHFLTALNANGRDVSQVIVVIDDPISSLDTRAQSHALALIKEYVGAAAQIFISTHHFHFATEVRRWLNYLGKSDNGQFFMETRSIHGSDRRVSKITEMPKLLKKYNSEYTYLFDIVFDYAEHGDGQTENAFLMPNAIRKLMEAFFSFKLPDAVNDDGKVNLHRPLSRARELWPQITQEDISVLDRVVNVASHGRMQSHEGASLPTIEEAHRAAKIAIKLIETCDTEHVAGLKRVAGKSAG